MRVIGAIVWVCLAVGLGLPAQRAFCSDSPDSACCCAEPVESPVTCCSSDAVPVEPPAGPACPCAVQNPAMPSELPPATQPDLRGKECANAIEIPWKLRALEAPRPFVVSIGPCSDGSPPAPPRFILLCSLLR